jgi:hypothetical protein
MSPPLPCQCVTARVGFCESNKAPSNGLGQLRKGSQATVVTAVLGRQTQHQRHCHSASPCLCQHSRSWFLRCASAVIGQPGPGSLPGQAAPMGHQAASIPIQSNPIQQALVCTCWPNNVWAASSPGCTHRCWASKYFGLSTATNHLWPAKATDRPTARRYLPCVRRRRTGTGTGTDRRQRPSAMV